MLFSEEVEPLEPKTPPEVDELPVGVILFGFAWALTVTVNDFSISFFVLTVIVVVPVFLPVMTPLSDTVAIEVSVVVESDIKRKIIVT